jgi:UDP-glucuronate 4-epimerase
MALFKFVENILADRPIEIYNFGRMERDFTYIDDLTEAVVRLVAQIPVSGRKVSPEDSLSPAAPFRIVNVGGGNPVPLPVFIDAIETALGRRAKRHYCEAQKGDVPKTAASTKLLEVLIGDRPRTPIAAGVAEFVRWYRDYHDLQVS